MAVSNPLMLTARAKRFLTDWSAVFPIPSVSSWPAVSLLTWPSATVGVVSETGSAVGCCSSAGAVPSAGGAGPRVSNTTGGPAETGPGSAGVTGVASFGLFDSRFFSSVRRNTLMVVRSALCGLQSSPDSGECSQTGHEAGKVEWQLSQMACSQHGRRKALTASLLQMAHRSFAGMSSWARELLYFVSGALSSW